MFLNFWRRPGSDKLLALEAAWHLLLVKLLLQHYSFNTLTGRYGLEVMEDELAGEPGHAATARAVGWAVERMGRAVPWNSVCLDRALAAQRMLSRRRLSGTLFLGVAKDKGNDAGLKAHAWVQSGGHFVTGRAGHEAFTVVSRFGWRAKSVIEGSMPHCGSSIAKEEEACETNGVS